MSADVEASNALYDVLERAISIERVNENYLAALDRVLVAWAVGEIEDIMRELGVDAVTIRTDP